MISAREWSQQYEMLKKNIQHKRINGSGFSSEEVKAIQNSINILESQLKTMSGSTLQYEIAASEIARRQVLIENLKKQTFTSSSPSPFKNGNLQISHPSSNRDSPSFNPLNTTDRGLQQRQKDVMKLQDDMVEDISSGVDRLHQKALAIGDEAREHNKIIGDLESNVDIATAALQAEAKHAEVIKDKAKVCWLYVCIAVEIFILFLLIMLSFVG